MEPMKWNCLMLHPLESGRMSVHKASPLLHWSACGWLVRRLVVKCTMLFQGCMTAISAELVVRHLFFFFFFPAGISIWWMAENGLDFSLLWSYITVCMAMQAYPLPFTQNWSFCRALRTTWMFLLVLFLFHKLKCTRAHVMLFKKIGRNCD